MPGTYQPLVIFLTPLNTSGASFAITIASNAPGTTFTVSGTGCAAGTYNAAATLTWTAGAQCTVSLSASGSFAFSGWSDGNTTNPRTFIAPSNAATLNAEFNEQPVQRQRDALGPQHLTIPIGLPLLPAPAARAAGPSPFRQMKIPERIALVHSPLPARRSQSTRRDCNRAILNRRSLLCGGRPTAIGGAFRITTT